MRISLKTSLSLFFFYHIKEESFHWANLTRSCLMKAQSWEYHLDYYRICIFAFFHWPLIVRYIQIYSVIWDSHASWPSSWAEKTRTQGSSGHQNPAGEEGELSLYFNTKHTLMLLLRPSLSSAVAWAPDTISVSAQEGQIHLWATP